MTLKHYNFTVKGRVQGVFFRASTREKAISLGLAGYVRNQPDGSVFIAAEGNEEQLKNLELWCRSGGPAGAQVHEVQQTEDKIEGWEEFSIKR